MGCDTALKTMNFQIMHLGNQTWTVHFYSPFSPQNHYCFVFKISCWITQGIIYKSVQNFNLVLIYKYVQNFIWWWHLSEQKEHTSKAKNLWSNVFVLTVLYFHCKSDKEKSIGCTPFCYWQVILLKAACSNGDLTSQA